MGVARAAPDARAATSLARDPAALVDELRRLEPAARADPAAIRVVRAPGRVNLIGEHTDYNDGLVLPAAIDLWLAIAFVATPDRRVRLTLAATGERAELDLDDLPERTGSWSDYVAGTAWSIELSGARGAGFAGLLAADLPIGAGLSSSAALELATAWALGGGASPLPHRLDIAQAARRAENEFVGVPSGLMDQFAVAFGVAGSAILLDCRSLEHRTVPIPDDLRLVICDSGVPRQLARSAYADRRAECARAVEGVRRVAPGVASLRDVDLALLQAARGELDDVAFRRARHVITENERVHATVAALEGEDVDRLRAVFAAGHASLRDDFEVSTPELDRLVEIASSTPGVAGARLTGAGFGGATVNLVAEGAAGRLVDRLRAEYRTPAGSPPAVHAVRPSDGVALVWPPNGATADAA